MSVCEECNATVSWFNLYDGKYCKACWNATRAGGTSATGDESSHDVDLAQHVLLTTETAHNLPVAQRIEIVTAECVIGMHLFKDIATAFRDTFGGRSKAMQDGLREARKAALSELRQEALAIGADAVVGVDLDYSEISGGGKSMLLLVASGTAVRLSQVADATATPLVTCAATPPIS